MMGDLCAFYDRPVASSRHTDHAPHSQPPTSHITLQSARNPRWYLGFGPNTPRARRNLGLNYFKGTTIQFSRKMKRRTNPHLRKCDYRFVSGIFTPHDTPTFSTPPHPQKEATPGASAPSSSSSWAGLFKHIEASHGSEVFTNDVEEASTAPPLSASAAATPLKKRQRGVNNNYVRKPNSQRASFTLEQLLLRRNHLLRKKTSQPSRISSSHQP